VGKEYLAEVGIDCIQAVGAADDHVVRGDSLGAEAYVALPLHQLPAEFRNTRAGY
jgi:hypothetical protein